MPVFSYSLGLTDHRARAAAELYATETKKAIEAGLWSAAHTGFGSTMGAITSSC